MPARSSAVKLSICITTFNRATFIGETLESILGQLTDDCEVVVLDGASRDDTEQVVSEYTRCCNRLRYVKQPVNNGWDRDCNRVVELATGEYCWLMTDDDLLMPGAIATVLNGLRRDVSLIIVNTEIRNLDMSKILQRRWIDFEADRVYGSGEMDRLFVEVNGWLNCNAFVINRAIWLARDKQPYYGSLLVHMGVIFQERLPTEVLAIAEPCISYRSGNAHTFSPVLGELVWEKWPSLAESLAVSESARRKVHSTEPWRHVQELLLWRGRGAYSLTEYRRWIRPKVRSTCGALLPVLVALIPGALVNTFFVLYYSVTRRRYRFNQPDLLLQALRESRFHFRNWRIFKPAS